MKNITRKEFMATITASAFIGINQAQAQKPDRSQAFVKAAENQINITLQYEPAYSVIKYPMGDVPRHKGVCTDVIIRAYRDALGVDLQQLVHEDMTANFGQYPKIWGLKKPDKNIDHRRVPNLRKFFERKGANLVVSDNNKSYKEGDIITQSVQGLPHIGIVSGDYNLFRTHPLIIHNIGQGTKKEDVLFAYPITGHYRFGV